MPPTGYENSSRTQRDARKLKLHTSTHTRTKARGIRHQNQGLTDEEEIQKQKEESLQSDILAHKQRRLPGNLKLGGRRSHVVIALLPFLEAQGAVEDLDVEDPSLAL